MKIRVLIADDHPIVRKGLKEILSETIDIHVAGEAGTGAEALRQARQDLCDVLLLDINLPDMSGVEVLKQLRSEGSRLFVLILSVYPEEQYAVRVLRAGAAGYLNKEAAPEQLISAIRKVAAGEKYISPSLAQLLARRLDLDRRKPLHETLSDREYEVLHLIGTGKKNIEIARKLSLSAKTVSTYRTRVLEKMQMQSNAEIIRYILEHKLS